MSTRVGLRHVHLSDLLISGYLDDELESAARADVDHALGQCELCRSRFDATAEVSAALRALPLETAPPGLIPTLGDQDSRPTYVERVMTALRGSPTGMRVALGSALMVLGVAFGVYRLAGPASPGVTGAPAKTALSQGLAVGPHYSNGDSTGSTGAGTTAQLRAGVGADTAVQGVAANGTSTSGRAAAPGVGDQARIARTAEVTLETSGGSFDANVAAVSSIANRLGGYISQSQVSEGEQRSASTVVRVPADRFQEALDSIRKVAHVKAYSTDASDVTKRYVDDQARLNSLRAQAAAMTRLLDKATAVQDILSVQQQLGTLQQQVEQAQADINYLDQSTAFASITVGIVQTETGRTPSNPIGDAFRSAGQGFVSTVQTAIVVLGTVGPLLILGFGLVLLAATWRRSRRRA